MCEITREGGRGHVLPWTFAHHNIYPSLVRAQRRDFDCLLAQNFRSESLAACSNNMLCPHSFRLLWPWHTFEYLQKSPVSCAGCRFTRLFFPPMLVAEPRPRADCACDTTSFHDFSRIPVRAIHVSTSNQALFRNASY